MYHFWECLLFGQNGADSIPTLLATIITWKQIPTEDNTIVKNYMGDTDKKRHSKLFKNIRVCFNIEKIPFRSNVIRLISEWKEEKDTRETQFGITRKSWKKQMKLKTARNNRKQLTKLLVSPINTTYPR